MLPNADADADGFGEPHAYALSHSFSDAEWHADAERVGFAESVGVALPHALSLDRWHAVWQCFRQLDSKPVGDA